IYNYRELREELSNEQGAGSREQPAGSEATKRAGSTEHRAAVTNLPSPVSGLRLANRTQETQQTPNASTWISSSDTEVLLRLLIRDGKAALPKLAGMFGFAFYDCESGRALLARDPFGIKPLYYLQRDGGLAFDSETRALRPLFPQIQINGSAVRDTLLWRSVPEPATLF